MRYGGSAQADMRSSLTGTFLHASALFAKRAYDIEAKNPSSIEEDLRVEHRGAVLAAIMQAVASLEAEMYEILVHGPGHHLGSNGLDAEAQSFLSPMVDLIDSEEILERYTLVLHLLKKEPLPRSNTIWEHALLLVRLRNSVVHYKSRWNREVESTKLLASLRGLRHAKPPFVTEHSLFFPHQCLSAACARWAARSALSFLNAFYENLGFPDRFAYIEEKFSVILPP